MRRILVAAALAAAVAAVAASVGASSPTTGAAQKFSKVNHIVVIYEENHSFDNLFGGWEGVNGRSNADAAHTTQVNEAGTPYTCLKLNDVNLASPPLAPTCTDTTTASAFASHFANAPFLIDDYIKPSDTTCPPNPNAAFSSPNGFANGTGSPGGCTRDIVHEFYQDQYQENGGAMNRFTTGSDAIGLTMGQYDTKQLPLYRYLHEQGHPHYAIADNFFQAAFGGSYLNHQYLIAATAPTYPNAPANLHSLIDSNGMPVAYPLYTPTGAVRRGPLTVTCPSPVPNRACGDYSVNTQQPSQQPFGAFGAKLPLQTQKTIGDELTAAGLDWAWYAGGWSNAAGDVNAPGWTNGPGPTCSDPNVIPNSPYPYCPDGLFQFHHQPFNYFANYGPGTPGRSHLQDEAAFQNLLGASGASCGLKAVSFVKPIGEENEHPGYSSTPNSQDHLVATLKAIEGSACAKDTMVIVTYDEFGGQWDHVPPPGQAGGPAGPHDLFGPGPRIPAVVLAPNLRGNFSVDSTEHDTTSILTTIEHRWGLQALTQRDAQQNDLSSVWDAHPVDNAGN